MDKYEVIKFKDNEFEMDVNVSPNEDTVWLTQTQMAELYSVDRTRITRHINNILNDNELDSISNVRKTHFPNSDKPVTTIYIGDSTTITLNELNLFSTNHNLTVIRTNKYHDRFIIIDDELYNIGSSIKDIGKKISHISKLEYISVDELLSKY